MSRDANTAIGPTVDERVVRQPLERHESYNFSAASVSRPSHAIHSAFFIGASLQIGRADVVRCCGRARRDRREIYLAQRFVILLHSRPLTSHN